MVITTRQIANRQGRTLFRDLNAGIVRAARAPGVDQVHDLRVIIRRFRRMLAAFKQYFPRAEAREVGRALKKMMKRAGAVRDNDIALHLLERTADPKSEPGKLSEGFRKRRDKAAKALVLLLKAWTMRDLPALSSSPAHKGASMDATARRVLPALASELFRRGRKAAHRKASPDTVHRCRIAAKNLRYTMDFFSPLYGNSLDGLIGELKDLQTLLGDVHDCDVVRAMMAGRKSSSDDKEFRSVLKERHRKKMKEFIGQYGSDFSSPEKLRLWTSRLRTVGTT